MKSSNFELEITGATTAYLRLPSHPGDLRNGRNVTLPDLLGPYKGPFVVFDFDAEGVLVGIEVIIEDDTDVEEPSDEGEPSESP